MVKAKMFDGNVKTLDNMRHISEYERNLILCVRDNLQ
jgi:hypothetical protein